MEMKESNELTERVRRRILIDGVVQGVGFRPFIYWLAHEHGVTGFVLNHSSGVRIEVEGPAPAIEHFQSDIRLRRPPLSVIDSFDTEDIAVTHDAAFVILESESTISASSPVSPDIAICDDCLRELQTPRDRRFGYPFINCTNCGPRFTIVRDLPYDRPATTMATFQMCPPCEAEYRDPLNRRFHAQPNACPQCGPHVSLIESTKTGFETDAQSTGTTSIAAVKALLSSGAIVGIKGIGGFHLACDATNDAALRLLRERKSRIEQPFALMARDLDVITRFAQVSGEEARLLSSRARPIVLLHSRKPNSISSLVAPHNEYLGVMLPYAPLHYLLLEETPLVMTSANVSGEPIVRENDEARTRLFGIADALLVNDREIEVVCDDSVVRTLEDKQIPLRRSRGYAPFPVVLKQPVDDLLAVGAELKATFCITKGRFAYLSQHIGDMGTLETQRAFETALNHMLRLFRVDPRHVVCDQHPGYLSTRWAVDFAKERGIELLQVQHHHAHAAALAAENGLEAQESVIGVAFDGTGYGSDGAIWGGEFLVASQASFSRFAHLRYAPLPGGDTSIKHPARTALAHLWQAGLEWDNDLPPVREFSASDLHVLRRQFDRNLNCVPSSSMGRLFDAVSALIGVRQRVNYEGQAAMELEALCQASGPQDTYPFPITSGGMVTLDPAPLLKAILRDLRSGAALSLIATRFHSSVAAAIVDVCKLARETTGLNTAALTGGVFQNIFLLRQAVERLRCSGFQVLWHRVVPANDGGLALGQAAIGHALLRQRNDS
jgi:hydrogenase maturation protein HypF